MRRPFLCSMGRFSSAGSLAGRMTPCETAGTKTQLGDIGYGAADIDQGNPPKTPVLPKNHILLKM